MDNPNSRKPRKEILHIDVEPDGIGTGALADALNGGWGLFAPPAWDATANLWRVLLQRDVVAPTPVIPNPPPTTRIISEATSTVVIPPVVIEPPAPVIEQRTTPDGAGESEDETPLEENTPAPAPAPQPNVIVVLPNLFPPLSFEDELRRIKADTTLSPKEKIEAIKKAGDEIAIRKAYQAGESVSKAWNELYPVSPNFRLLPEGVKV